MSPENRCEEGAKAVSEARPQSTHRTPVRLLATAALSLLVSFLGLASTAMAVGLGFGGPQVTLNGLGCGSPGNCTAVGGYYDTLNHGQAVAWTETGGHWADGVTLRPPKNARKNAFDFYGAGGGITSLSCPAVGDCTAVGDYLDSVGNQRGVLFTEHNGQWSHGAEAVMPSDRFDPTARTGNGRGYASVPAVSCVSAGNCVAIGYYLNEHGAVKSVIFVESGGSWGTAKLVNPPSGALTGDYMYTELDAISCSSDGTCTAVGSYVDSSGNQQGWVITIRSGSVLTSAELPMPTGPEITDPNPAPQFTSISCVDATDCGAVGNYTIDYEAPGTTQPVNNGNLGGLLLLEQSGTWQATEVVLPSDAAPIDQPYAQDTGMFSVDCPATTSCTAVGYYSDNNTNIQGEVMDETSGTWTSAKTVALPNNAATDVETQLVLPGPVSCSSPGYCGASAVYANVTGNEIPLLASETGSGSWSSIPMSLPAGYGADQEVGGLAEISCPALSPPAISTNNDCTVLGEYQRSHGAIEGFATTQTSSGAWGTPTELHVPGPTRADLRVSLKRVMRPKRRGLNLRRIIKHGGYTFHYHSLEAGKLTIVWRIRRGNHARMIGHARVYPRRRGRLRARVQLTTFGSNWVRRHAEVRVHSTAAFKARRARRVVRRSTFTLRK